MAYVKTQKGSLWQRVFAWVVVLALGIGFLPARGLSQARADDGGVQPAQALSVNAPIAEPNESMEGSGQLVTWDCIWFGFYPQTEVEADEVPQNVTWDDNGDASIDGVKLYRRITRDDTTYDANWPEDAGEYRYFRYEPIKWRVLKVDNEEGTAFCVSDVGLDCQAYNTNYTEVTWETSSMRSWLNGYSDQLNQPETNFSSKNFINAAFTGPERANIIQSSIENKDNLNNGASGGKATKDHIFLLSESEVYGDPAVNPAASHGFSLGSGTSDEARFCTASDFANAMGTYIYKSEELGTTRCDWWLRSPGTFANTAVFVYSGGYVYRAGCGVDDVNVAVRPALNLKLDSSQVRYAGTVASNGERNEQLYGGDISKAKIAVKNCIYNAKPQRPKPSVTLNGVTLIEGKDYRLSYENNISKGKATVTVIGIRSYKNQATANFTIANSDDPCFGDVDTNKLGPEMHGAIHDAKDFKLVQGYKGGNYGPSYPVTRGQAAVMFWNLAGKPTPSKESFKDVKPNSYYYNATRWAKEAGVVNGYPSGNFWPNARINREDLAVMFANYAKHAAKIPDVSGTQEDFADKADADTVSTYAISSIGWCLKTNILYGTDNNEVAPKSKATRANIAAMMVHFYKLLLNPVK